MQVYKLLSYGSDPKDGRAGILVGSDIHNVELLTGRSSHRTVLGVLEDWPTAEGLVVAALDRLAPASKIGDIASINILAPILFPGTYFCAAANYRDHSEAMAKREGRPVAPDPRPLNIRPYHFLKSGKQATVGPSETIEMPKHCKNLDWELELAAVIGRPCKGVSTNEALNYVAGYTVSNDLSVRDSIYTHRPNVPATSPFSGDFLSFKGFDKSAILGPWITPASQIGDPTNLNMKLWINGELMQDSNSSKMIYTAAEQIAYLSERITLLPGDVVMTGTPAGTGAEQDRFLKPGDTIRMWIENIGELQNKIVA